MVTTKKRLEQIENALIALAGGGAGFAAGRMGVGPAAKAAVRSPIGQAALAGYTYGQIKEELDARDTMVAEQQFGPTAGALTEIAQRLTPLPIPIAQTAALGASIGIKARKKAKSKFNKAVGAAMKGVKKSTQGGPKGVISKPKAVFSKVTKIASKINQAKKAKVKLPKRPKGKVDRLVYDITKRILK